MIKFTFLKVMRLYAHDLYKVEVNIFYFLKIIYFKSVKYKNKLMYKKS